MLIYIQERLLLIRIRNDCENSQLFCVLRNTWRRVQAYTTFKDLIIETKLISA